MLANYTSRNILYKDGDKLIFPSRRVIRDQFLKACRNYGTFLDLDLRDQFKIVCDIESACYNKTIQNLQLTNDDYQIFGDKNKQFLNTYSMYCYKYIANLDIESNINSDEFISRIISKDINLDNIIDLKSEELCPNKTQKIRNDVKLRQQIGVQQKVSHNYTCPRCKQKEVVYTFLQTKSSDEACDIRLECVKCHTVWWK